MANEIKAKYSASAALTCTLASLATSAVGVGRQCTLVDNSTNRYQRLHLFFKVTTGTSPTANKGVYFYMIKRDDHASPTIATDNAGGSDAAFTAVTADQVYAAATSSVSDTAYRGSFSIDNPGPSWGLAVVHDTGVNLNSTGGNHEIRWVGENPEVQ